MTGASCRSRMRRCSVTASTSVTQREGRLSPVIGRDEEIRRSCVSQSRRTKNNPVLVGEPGVGKTAIVEGLAQRIIRGDIPENLARKTIFRSTWGRSSRGPPRGEFEERLKAVLGAVPPPMAR